jgi:hypothetical protein
MLTRFLMRRPPMDGQRIEAEARAVRIRIDAAVAEPAEFPAAAERRDVRLSCLGLALDCCEGAPANLDDCREALRVGSAPVVASLLPRESRRLRLRASARARRLARWIARLERSTTATESDRIVLVNWLRRAQRFLDAVRELLARDGEVADQIAAELLAVAERLVRTAGGFNSPGWLPWLPPLPPLPLPPAASPGGAAAPLPIDIGAATSPNGFASEIRL